MNGTESNKPSYMHTKLSQKPKRRRRRRPRESNANARIRKCPVTPSRTHTILRACARAREQRYKSLAFLIILAFNHFEPLFISSLTESSRFFAAKIWILYIPSDGRTHESAPTADAAAEHLHSHVATQNARPDRSRRGNRI